MFKKTKIVCTMGPSTDQPGIVEKMLEAGMNVARFNFSHGSHKEHQGRMARVREAAANVNKNVAILLDTKGPEMRLGLFKDGKVELVTGQKFVLTAEVIDGTVERATVNHPGLPEDVKAGDTILLSDGLVSLVVEAVEGTEIITTVQNNGVIGNRKRVAAPGVAVNLPPLSDQDVADIRFGLTQGIDFIAASFIQRAADILAIRKILEDAGAEVDIIAKIENVEGVRNMDEILQVADGIMVARGDLGVEIPAEDVPLIQKELITKCNIIGKPVITATQMLESMVNNPRPTRAEASDVANAIFDGTDAIMLSGETASGDYPVEAVETMARIAVRTEKSLPYAEIYISRGALANQVTTEAISHATVQIAQELSAAAIVTSSEKGYTARMVSKYRPKAAIVAVSQHPATIRRMQLYWGVVPVPGNASCGTDEMVENAVEGALESGAVNPGDLIVITAGVPLGMSGTTNMIRVHVVGDVLLRGTGLGQKAATGKVCVVNSAADLVRFKAGDVMVVKSIHEEIAARASEAAAIVAEEGGLTSPAAIVGISFGMPVLVGVEGATMHLPEGMLITVDPVRGQVYHGKANAR
nr:pyruvate kinase [uncultured Anaeromusa sp.]